MRVIIFAGGRFWSFEQARELEKRGALSQLITSFPKFLAARSGIPRKKIRSVVIAEILRRSWKKLPYSIQQFYNPQYFITEVFDRVGSVFIREADIFTGLASLSLHGMRAAKKRGAVTVIERGNSHILDQERILSEEYERFGLKMQLSDPRLVEKELKEYEETDYIYVPSLFVKRSFLQRGFPEKKLIHIPFGVDLSFFKKIPKEDDVFRVVFVGGMLLRKGVHYLLRAFAELNLPNAELMLLGSLNEEIKPFFKKYEGTFRYVGHISRNELYTYYSQGSVFVILSIEEGLALVQPQAMACGLPVICTTNTGGEDIVRNGIDGFVIPIRDIDVLKEKLVYLYNHPEICRAMGESARERVASGFTWNDYGEKLFAAYNQILNPPHNKDYVGK